jgi:putative sensor protein
MSTMYAAPPPIAPQRPAPPAHLSRTRLFGWSVVMMTTWPVATVLFCVWVTAVALSPLTVFLPVLVGLTGAVRSYAGVHRRWTERMLGDRVAAPYRPATATGWVARAKNVLTDRASWRDAWWLLVHSTVGCFLATLAFSLLAGSVFYAIYPFLYWVTPDPVFRQPFGFFTLHSVGQSFALVPLGLAMFGLWFASVRPIMLAHARLTRSLLH